MKRRIWKFELSSAPTAGVMMPKGSHVLSAAAQGKVVCVWAICDPEQPVEPRDFWVLGTGFLAPDGDERYVGTAHCTDGLVWHVFEVKA